jgi:hypothetical protein
VTLAVLVDKMGVRGIGMAVNFLFARLFKMVLDEGVGFSTYAERTTRVEPI